MYLSVLMHSSLLLPIPSSITAVLRCNFRKRRRARVQNAWMFHHRDISRGAPRRGVTLRAGQMSSGGLPPGGYNLRRPLICGVSSSAIKSYHHNSHLSRKKSCELIFFHHNSQLFCLFSLSLIRFMKSSGSITLIFGPNERTLITISVSSSLS